LGTDPEPGAAWLGYWPFAGSKTG